MSISLCVQAKRVCVYLAHSRHERLLEELVNELQAIDTFGHNLERAHMMPFYRWKTDGEEDEDDDAATAVVDGGDGVAKQSPGLIHTRRHAPNDISVLSHNRSNSNPGVLPPSDVPDDDTTPMPTSKEMSASMSSLITLKADVVNARHMAAMGGGGDRPATTPNAQTGRGRAENVRQYEWTQAYQLPMPAYGGHACELNVYMPPSTQPPTQTYKCNLALMLLTDLLVAVDVDVDWSIHLPLMLHMATLGLDSVRPIVHDHCAQLILNVLLVHADTRVVDTRLVANVLLANALATPVGFVHFRCVCTLPLQDTASRSDTPPLVTSSSYRTHESLTNSSQQSSFRETDTNSTNKFGTVDSHASTASTALMSANGSSGTERASTPSRAVVVMRRRDQSCSYTQRLLGTSDSVVGNSLHMHLGFGRRRVLIGDGELAAAGTAWLNDTLVAIVDCLSSNMGRPLWACEDVTARQWRIDSGDQLTNFTSHLCAVLHRLLPTAGISIRWAQTALQVALCCSNRHLAGRSFQVTANFSRQTIRLYAHRCFAHWASLLRSACFRISCHVWSRRSGNNTMMCCKDTSPKYCLHLTLLLCIWRFVCYVRYTHMVEFSHKSMR
jgi:hypothetical protein